MTEKQYLEYIVAIKDFIGSKEINPFNAESFVYTLIAKTK